MARNSVVGGVSRIQYKGIGPVTQDIVAVQIPIAVVDTVVVLTGLGLEVVGDLPEQFSAFLESEGKRWLPLIWSLNIRLD